MYINKYNHIRNLALFLIAGNMLGWLFPFPNVVWRVSLVLLSLYVILIEEGRHLPCEKTLLCFVAFNLLHFFISYLWKTPSFTQIGNILCALLPLSLFICLAEKKVMTDQFIALAGSILLVAAVFQFYNFQRITIERFAVDEDSDFTNNASVAFLMLLPMLFLMKNLFQKWATLLICLFFLVMGAKRGNILAAIIPISLFVWFSLKDSHRALLKTTLVLVFIIGGSIITYRWVENNDYLLHRIEQAQEGNSSGRDMIYAGAWHAWCDSDSFVYILLGRGFDETLKLESTGHHHAHNDWLELLVNYGLLGVVFYFAVFISFLTQVSRIKGLSLKMAFISGLCIWFFKSLYSMGFTGEALSVAMISMGTALGRNVVQ